MSYEYQCRPSLHKILLILFTLSWQKVVSYFFRRGPLFVVLRHSPMSWETVIAKPMKIRIKESFWHLSVDWCGVIETGDVPCCACSLLFESISVAREITWCEWRIIVFILSESRSCSSRKIRRLLHFACTYKLTTRRIMCARYDAISNGCVSSRPISHLWRCYASTRLYDAYMTPHLYSLHVELYDNCSLYGITYPYSTF